MAWRCRKSRRMHSIRRKRHFQVPERPNPMQDVYIRSLHRRPSSRCNGQGKPPPITLPPWMSHQAHNPERRHLDHNAFNRVRDLLGRSVHARHQQPIRRRPRTLLVHEQRARPNRAMEVRPHGALRDEIYVGHSPSPFYPAPGSNANFPHPKKKAREPNPPPTSTPPSSPPSPSQGTSRPPAAAP